MIESIESELKVMSETETFREYAFLTREDVTEGFMPLIDTKSFAVIASILQEHC